MSKTYTAMQLAVSAKSGGGTTAEDVTDLIDSHVEGLTDAEFEALHDQVMALIPAARFCEREARGWAMADAQCHAEDAAERRSYHGFAA